MAIPDFLTVAGVVLECFVPSWGIDPPDTLGEEQPMLDGALGSTERTPMFRASGEVGFRTMADLVAFRTAISVSGAPGVPTPVTATSGAMGITLGVTYQVHARLGRIVPRKQAAGGAPEAATYRVPLSLRQTEP